MSVHFIYIIERPNEKGELERVKMMRPVTTREEYLKLRNSRRQQYLVKVVRNGNEQKKTSLVQFAYSCLPNPDGSLRGSTTLSSTISMDIDHVPADQMDAVKERIMAHKEELGLMMLELSARAHGYHLVFRRRDDLSQEDNLKWAADRLEVQHDEGAVDLTRVLFTTTASKQDLLFLDDEIFVVKEAESREIENGKLKIENSSTCENNLTQECDNFQFSTFNSQLNYNGIPYSDIINKYWELYNGGKQPVDGDRNVKTFELAVNLRCICDYSLDKMLQVVPNYFGDSREGVEEWRRTIESALKEPRKGMPFHIKQVLKALKENNVIKACGGTLTTPPPIPKRLPPLIKLLTSNVPDLYKPAVASAVFPALGAHLHGVKFRYWDNVEHEPTFMSVLIGRQSVGKGCIKKPIEYIMEDIRLRDFPNRQRESEWKQRNPGSRPKKDPRPTDICIQMLIDNLTDAVFNQRVIDVNNNGQRFIYTIVDEIEALKKVTSKGTVDEVGLLIRKAFDNSLCGQERVGADSVSGIAPLRWNFNASTTPLNARRFLGKMVNDGTISRLDIATIIRPEDDEDKEPEDPVIGIYDDRFAADLKPYLERLEAASGLIECPAARQLAIDIKQENRDVARMYDSEAYKVLSYRSNVIAWLKGMLLYVAQGYKWDNTIAEFVRWTQQYNLWCKMLYFGNQLEQELREETVQQRQSGPQNFLDLLPEEFTLDQYHQMRYMRGCTGKGQSTLRCWVARGYLVHDAATGRYCKTSQFMGKGSLL